MSCRITLISALVCFVAHAEESPHLQQSLCGSGHISQVIELAAECGFVLSLEALCSVSKEVCAPWWLCSDRGSAWCCAFSTQNEESEKRSQN